MSYSRETKVGVGPAPQQIDETFGGGPLVNMNEIPALLEDLAGLPQEVA